MVITPAKVKITCVTITKITMKAIAIITIYRIKDEECDKMKRQKMESKEVQIRT